MVRAGRRYGRGAGGSEPRRRAPDLGEGERRGCRREHVPVTEDPRRDVLRSPWTAGAAAAGAHGGACPPELSIAVARGGGMGAMGARRHDKPGKLAKRSKSDAGFPSAPGLRGTEE